MQHITFSDEQLDTLGSVDSALSRDMARYFNDSTFVVTYEQADNSALIEGVVDESIIIKDVSFTPITNLISDPFKILQCTLCAATSRDREMNVYDEPTSHFILGIARWDGSELRIRNFVDTFDGMSENCFVDGNKMVVCPSCAEAAGFIEKVTRYLHHLIENSNEPDCEYVVSVTVEGSAELRVTCKESQIEDRLNDLEAEIGLEFHNYDYEAHLVYEEFRPVINSYSPR